MDPHFVLSHPHELEWLINQLAKVFQIYFHCFGDHGFSWGLLVNR